jgi:arylsulfatase A-like enzyme
MFQDAKVPREANFNPENPSGASWVKDLPRLNEKEVESGDTFYRARLQSLQAIDEMVDEVFKRLEEYDILDDTYIVFTSDNGYHISQHRLPPGKSCGYEEDINVPLYIRGPGIPKAHVSEAVTAHIDLLPTFFRMAGISQREDFDGTPIPWNLDGSDEEVKIEHANIEMWKNSYTINKLPTRKREVEAPGNNTYKSVRLIGQEYSLYYSVWCTNEHEMYDMNVSTLFSRTFHDMQLTCFQ